MAAKRKPRKYTLAQKRADPNLRATLPASKLTAAQQKQRKVNTRIAAENANPLYNPLAPLSGHDLLSAAKQITEAQYGPTLSSLARQMATTTAQGAAVAQRSGDYYKQIAQSEADAIGRQQALGTMTQGQIGQAGATAQSALASAATAEQARRTADAGVRGAGLGGANTTAALDELAHGQGVAAASTQNAQSRAAGSAQDWASLENALSASASMRGGEAQTQLLNQLASAQSDIRGKIADASAAKAGDYSKQLLALRQQGFENEATRQGLNLKDFQISTTANTAAANREQAAADKAAGRAVTKRGQDVTASNNATNAALHQAALDERIRHDKRAEHIAALNRAKGVKEPAAAITIRKSVGSITGWATEILSRPGNANLGRKQLAQQVRNYVANRKLGSLPDYTLSPALDLILDGHVSQRNMQILQSYGVDVAALAPYAGKPRKKPKKSLLNRAAGN